MPDKYESFEDLRRDEREGEDYVIRIDVRPSSTAIVAPHGGNIERGSSEIACVIARDDLTLYRFEGVRKRPHHELHITSSRFDEPQCLRVLADCDVVVTVHGLKGTDLFVDIGGQHAALRDAIRDRLAEAGFDSRVVTTGPHAGMSPRNICNRGRTGAGVQLELTRGLRRHLLESSERLAKFADAVRGAIAHVPAAP